VVFCCVLLVIFSIKTLNAGNDQGPLCIQFVSLLAETEQYYRLK
jgi:hypothetical protein